jgi:3-methyladenine DNA glycosylase AlkD
MAEKTETDALLDEINAEIAALKKPTTAQMRALRRGFSARVKAWPPRAVVALALRVREGPLFVHRMVAYELIHYHAGALASLTAADLERLGRGLDSWYVVDTFAPYLAGPAWRNGQISDAVVTKWAKSKDLWWRRAALVSTVALNNKARGGAGRGDAGRTLAVCALLVNDREDMVVKALSWALRELAKRDPGAVRGFVEAHDPALAARVKREVANKLRTGLKTPKGRKADA